VFPTFVEVDLSRDAAARPRSAERPVPRIFGAYASGFAVEDHHHTSPAAAVRRPEGDPGPVARDARPGAAR
jgi:hypothetical protein